MRRTLSNARREISEWWAWVDLNHRPRPYQGLLWCYMHSSVAMITLLTTSLMVTSWHDCWFQVARSVQSGDHFLQRDLSRSIAEKLLTLQKGRAPATFTPNRLTTRGTAH